MFAVATSVRAVDGFLVARDVSPRGRGEGGLQGSSDGALVPWGRAVLPGRILLTSSSVLLWAPGNWALGVPLAVLASGSHTQTFPRRD